jgi:hypothetical protein
MWRCLETEKRTTKGQHHTRHQKGDRNKGKQTHRSCSQEAEVLLNVSLADCFRQEEATTRCTEGQTKANRNNNDSDSEDRNRDARENLHHKKLNHHEKNKTVTEQLSKPYFGQEGRSDTGKLLQSMEIKRQTNRACGNGNAQGMSETASSQKCVFM